MSDNFWYNLGQGIVNFANTWASLFGIDLVDRIAGKKRGDWDEVSTTKVINELYRYIEQSDNSNIQKATSQLEALIGSVNSPTIKGIISRWKKKLQKKLEDAQNNAAEHQLDKAQLQNMAGEIANLDAFAFDDSNSGRKKKQEFRAKVLDVAQKNDPSAINRIKKIDGWKTFEDRYKEDEKEYPQLSNNVEERL